MYNSQAKPQGRRYSEEIKMFALTLHYYSPKAYDFVKPLLHLPDPSSLRAWSASVNCEPGFFQDVIEKLSDQLKCNDWMADAVLIIDAMAIRKETIWDDSKKKYVGNVDYGKALPEPCDNLASEALVFMLAGATGHWKHPIGYFLIDKISAKMQDIMIKVCLSNLMESGFLVHAVIFDGTYVNQYTATKLGCKFNVSEMKPWFSLPTYPDHKIYIFLMYVI